MPDNPSPAWLSTEEREALTQGYGHHSRGAEHVARKLVRHAAEADRRLKEQAAEISRFGLIADMEIERAKTVDERNGVLFRRNIEQAEKIAALEKLSVFAGGFDLRMAESRDELKHENRFLKAEVTRLREALEAIEKLKVEPFDHPPEKWAEHTPETCAECKRWADMEPPHPIQGTHCDGWFRLFYSRGDRREEDEARQHWTMRNIAREALAATQATTSIPDYLDSEWGGDNEATPAKPAEPIQHQFQPVSTTTLRCKWCGLLCYKADDLEGEEKICSGHVALPAEGSNG